MTVTTNERGQQNLFAREPQMYISKTDAERYGYETYAEKAEKLNGRTAMLGFAAAVLSYTFCIFLYFLMWSSSLRLVLHSLYCLVILYNNSPKLTDGFIFD